MIFGSYQLIDFHIVQVRMAISEIIQHEDWNTVPLDQDFALLRMASKVNSYPCFVIVIQLGILMHAHHDLCNHHNHSASKTQIQYTYLSCNIVITIVISTAELIVEVRSEISIRPLLSI